MMYPSCVLSRSPLAVFESVKSTIPVKEPSSRLTNCMTATIIKSNNGGETDDCVLYSDRPTDRPTNRIVTRTAAAADAAAAAADAAAAAAYRKAKARQTS
jgi:hypothetical protein